MKQSTSTMQETRVLCVVRWPVGGIRTYLLDLCPLLIAEGYRFSFVGPDDESFRQFGEMVSDWPDVECHAASLNGRRCDLRGTARRLLRTGRYSLLNTQGLTAACHGVLANIGMGVPHVAISHDVLRDVQFQGAVGLVKRLLMGRLLARVDRLICVSHDAARNHAEFFPALARTPGKLVAIPNGINLDRLDKQPAEPVTHLRSRFAIADGVMLIGFLGRFMEQKGFLSLLDALVQLKATGVPREFRLVAVGSGDYEREYRREVTRRGLDDLVHFHPAVPNAAPLLRQLDLLVMPSLWEACPLLPMEAMCLGVPVLGTDCIGLREVLMGSPSRTVRAGDAVGLERGLRLALSYLWKQEAQAYCPQAHRRFEVQIAAEQMMAAFGVRDHSVMTGSLVS